MVEIVDGGAGSVKMGEWKRVVAVEMDQRKWVKVEMGDGENGWCWKPVMVEIDKINFFLI